MLEHSTTTLQQYYLAAFIGLLFCLLVLYIAKKNGFFKLPESSLPSVGLGTLLGGIFTYIAASLVIVPFVLLGVLYLKKGTIVTKHQIIEEVWWPAVSLAMIFICIALFILLIRKTAKIIIWGKNAPSLKQLVKNIGHGMLAWIVSYPSVLLMGILGNIISLWLWNTTGVKQTAVEYLLKTAPYPFLYAITAIFLITIVPFTEEFLFRGLLQSYLRRFFGRIGAIFLSGAVFSLVHYAPSQGTGNLELILSLFILACFLGFVYERQQSLWAPIGLHMSFNAFSIILLILT